MTTSSIMTSFDNFDEIDLSHINSEEDQAQFFKNIKVLCKFNSKIHLVSYLHLQFINNIMLFVVILGSFISGLLDTINHNEEPDKNKKLIFGCIEIFFAILITYYKQSKIADTQRDHYHYSNSYKILLNKINTDLLLINSNTSIYKTNINCIKDITDQFNYLIANAPMIPLYIFRKYKVKRIDNKCYRRSSRHDVYNTGDNREHPLTSYRNTSVSVASIAPNVFERRRSNDVSNTYPDEINDENVSIDMMNINTDSNSSDESIEEIKKSPKITDNTIYIPPPKSPISMISNSESPKKRTTVHVPDDKSKRLSRSYSVKQVNSIGQHDIDNINILIDRINTKHNENNQNIFISNFKKIFLL